MMSRTLKPNPIGRGVREHPKVPNRRKDFLILRIKSKGKKIKVRVKRAGLLGLMFKSENTHNLFFSFKRDIGLSITSYFVFFPFLVIWLDKNKKVIEYEMVRPFTLSVRCRKKFRSFVEIPVNERNLRLIRFFVGKSEKFKYKF